MIRLTTAIFGFALLSTSAFAQTQMPPEGQQPQQQPQMQPQQQPQQVEPQQQPQQQQQAQSMQQQQKQQAQSQPSEMTGTVQGLEGQTVTLDVAGQEIKIEAEKQQLQGLEEGDRVQVTAVPFPEAESIQPAQGQDDSKYLLGTVQQKQKDSVTLQTQDQQTREVRVDPKQAENIQQGQQVIVELKQQAGKASQWKAKQIKPMS